MNSLLDRDVASEELILESRAMGLAEPSIIAELETALSSGSPEKRVNTLRQVTGLFLNDAERLSDDQVKIFDEVFCLLVTRVENWARAELSARLAQNDHAPSDVIQLLARDDEIAVAGSVLANSTRLRTGDLIEIASTKGQDHLFAISGRAGLPESVTDVILDRGDGRVIRKLASNASARFSETGYSSLVDRADTDDALAEVVGLRTDLPRHILRELLRRATEAVRSRLMALAPVELQDEVRRILEAIADAATDERPPVRDFKRSEQLVRLMSERGKLNDEAIIQFASAKNFDELAASLALLSAAPTSLIARVLEGARSDLVLIPCKSSGLGWPAAEAILCNRPGHTSVDERTLRAAHNDFETLSPENAQRTVRFWMVHDKIVK